MLLCSFNFSELVPTRQIWRLCLRFHLHDGDINAVRKHSRHFEHFRNEGVQSVCDQWHFHDGDILPVPDCDVALLVLLVQPNSEHNIHSGK